MNWNPISLIVETVGGMFNAREDRKKTKASLSAKIQMQKEGNGAQVQFNEQEIDMLNKMNENGSWKDEYLTVIITLPIPTLFVCVFLSVLLEDPLIAQAAKDATEALKALIPDYGALVLATVVAGLGLRAWKRP